MSWTCDCAGRPCRRAEQREPPATLSELAARTKVEFIADGLETLALVGAYFDDALFTTRNSGALLSGRGGYGRTHGLRDPWRLSPNRVTIRHLAGGEARIARSTATGPNEHDSLAVFDRSGTIMHRIQYVTEQDAKVAASLDAGDHCAFAPAKAPDDQVDGIDVISLAEFRTARDAWETGDAAIHLSELIATETGRRRRRLLARIGLGRAWPVRPDALPMFIGGLVENGIPHARVVFGRGLLQADVCTRARCQKLGALLLVDGRQGTFALDIDALGSAWVIRARRTWHLECYGKDDAPIAAIALAAGAPDRAWREALCAIPRADWRR